MLDLITQGHLIDFDAIMYIFDLTDAQSLKELENLHHVVHKRVPIRAQLLLGNKLDLVEGEEPVSQSQIFQKTYQELNYLADKFSQRSNIRYLKISALKNHNITDVFVEIVKQVLTQNHNLKISSLELNSSPIKMEGA